VSYWFEAIPCRQNGFGIYLHLPQRKRKTRILESCYKGGLFLGEFVVFERFDVFELDNTLATAARARLLRYIAITTFAIHGFSFHNIFSTDSLSW